MRHPVAPPRPTHSRYHNRTPEKLDPDVEPWITMAQALEWDHDDQAGFPRKADGRESINIDGTEYRARDLRTANKPSFGVTEKIRSWTHYAPAGVSQKSRLDEARRLDEAPAPTVTSQANHYFYDENVNTFGENISWEHTRPSTTVCGDPRLSGPGRNDPNTSGSQYGTNARKITIEEAATLQGFPPGYTFTGSKTSQFKQIGNACNPIVTQKVYEGLQ